MPISPQSEFGAFLPINTVFDTQQLVSMDVKSPEFKNAIVKMREIINQICIVTNIKVSGYFPLFEFVNGKLWYPNPLLDDTTPQTPAYRQVFVLVINFGQLPNATSRSVAHNLTIGSGWRCTQIYGTATDQSLPAAPTPWSIPLPYVDVAGVNPVQLDVTLTSVVVTTISDMTRFNACDIVMEYIKE